MSHSPNQTVSPEQLLIDGLPEVLRLDPRHEHVIRVGDNIHIVSPPEPSRVVSLPGQQRFPRNDVDRIADRILTLLTLARTWRALGTYGPPASQVIGNRLMHAVTHAHGIEPQDIVDRLHRAFREDIHANDAWVRNRWGIGKTPQLHSEVDMTGHWTPISLGDGDPWIAGHAHKFVVDAVYYSPDPRLAIRSLGATDDRRHPDRPEVKVTDKFPETVLAGLIDRPISEVVPNAVLDQIDARIVDASTGKG